MDGVITKKTNITSNNSNITSYKSWTQKRTTNKFNQTTKQFCDPSETTFSLHQMPEARLRISQESMLSMKGSFVNPMTPFSTMREGLKSMAQSRSKDKARVTRLHNNMFSPLSNGPVKTKLAK